MARNRKRAKERRARQPQPVASGRGRNGRALAEENDYEAAFTDQHSEFEDFEDGAPSPIEHAAPDAQIAEERLAIGAGIEPVSEDELALEAADAAPDERLGPPEPPRPPAPPTSPERPGASGPAAAPHRRWLGARLLAFLEGSWRELQRVQWPDRRQVMQATGVVVGFVIVASVFLGVADFLAGKVVHFLIYGNF